MYAEKLIESGHATRREVIIDNGRNWVCYSARISFLRASSIYIKCLAERIHFDSVLRSRSHTVDYL